MAKIIKYRAVRTMVTRTSIDEFSESGPHGTELRDLFVDPRQMVFGDMLHGSALPSIILIESQQVPAILNRKPQSTGATEKRQFVQIFVLETAIAVFTSQRPDEADVLIVAYRLRGQA